MNGGQQCISPDYVLVHKDVLSHFASRATHWVNQFYGKDPKASPAFGRIVGAYVCMFVFIRHARIRREADGAFDWFA